MQTVFKNIQIADDQQQRHMLKIGEVSKRKGIGIEALSFTRRAACWTNPSGQTAVTGCTPGVGAPCLYQAGASFARSKKSSKLSMISVQGRVLVLRCANSYACACKNSMNACNRCSAIAKNWQRPWPSGTRRAKHKAYLRLIEGSSVRPASPRLLSREKMMKQPLSLMALSLQINT